MPMEDGGNTRILNQAEIDSLLGFDDAGGESETSGVMALINSALVNYERLPMLDIVFDRLVRLMSTSLRNLTSDNVEVSLDQISTVRFGDYLNSIPLPAMLSVFKAEEGDNNGLIVVDSSLIYSVVDVLLGGRKGTPSIRVEGRPYTTIETRLVERMLNVTLSDMSSAFDPLSPVSFKLENMETNPRFAAITQSGNACVLVRMRIDMGDRGGRVEILIPYATLEPVRELLLQMFMGEKFGRDSIWETHLTNYGEGASGKSTGTFGKVFCSASSVVRALARSASIAANIAPDFRSPMRLTTCNKTSISSVLKIRAASLGFIPS